jgi:hypothetical protein
MEEKAKGAYFMTPIWGAILGVSILALIFRIQVKR